MTPDPADEILALLAARRLRKLRRAERRRQNARIGLTLAMAGAIVAGLIGVVGIGAATAVTVGCDLSTLQPVGVGENSFVYAADGSLLGSIPSERNRQPVALDRMTPWLPAATVAIEDRRFFAHGGLDYQGIVRALWRDISAGRVVEGGSTITQQLVRNLYTGQEQTLGRKLREACLAIKLSGKWSKHRILETYLNTVYYGNHAYGVEAAAETYFSRHAENLNLAQAALIAGLPQAPSVYDPFHNPAGAVARRNEVLGALLAQGRITAAQYRFATHSDALSLKPGRVYTRIKQPYFFSYVIDELVRHYGANTVRQGGLRVTTTIIPRDQWAATRAIKKTLNEPHDPAAAVVTVEPGTGAIRAMAAVVPGDTANQFNLAAQSARQAGSTFKPFVLATAIEEGMNPDTTTYQSMPYECVTSPWCAGDYAVGKPWIVQTYDHTYAGAISVTRATLASDNTVYAQLTLDANPQKVWLMAQRLGVHLTQPPVASIGLGPLSVSPLDMATAYATFASGGIYAQPMAITKVVLPTGETDTTAGWGVPHTHRAIAEAVAWKVNDVLHQNAEYGTGAGSGDGIHVNAGKTGTTEDHADGWFVGYTRDLATAVWMGYPAGEIPMYSVHGRAVAGATFAVPIWHLMMLAAEHNLPARPFLTPPHPPKYTTWKKGSWGYPWNEQGTPDAVTLRVPKPESIFTAAPKAATPTAPTTTAQATPLPTPTTTATVTTTEATVTVPPVATTVPTTTAAQPEPTPDPTATTAPVVPPPPPATTTTAG